MSRRRPHAFLAKPTFPCRWRGPFACVGKLVGVDQITIETSVEGDSLPMKEFRLISNVFCHVVKQKSAIRLSGVGGHNRGCTSRDAGV